MIIVETARPAKVRVVVTAEAVIAVVQWQQ